MSASREWAPPDLALELLERRYHRKAFSSGDRRVDEWLVHRALPAIEPDDAPTGPIEQESMRFNIALRADTAAVRVRESKHAAMNERALARVEHCAGNSPVAPRARHDQHALEQL